jgi:hypothetical protein
LSESENGRSGEAVAGDDGSGVFLGDDGLQAGRLILFHALARLRPRLGKTDGLPAIVELLPRHRLIAATQVGDRTPPFCATWSRWMKVSGVRVASSSPEAAERAGCPGKAGQCPAGIWEKRPGKLINTVFIYSILPSLRTRCKCCFNLSSCRINRLCLFTLSFPSAKKATI